MRASSESTSADHKRTGLAANLAVHLCLGRLHAFMYVRSEQMHKHSLGRLWSLLPPSFATTQPWSPWHCSSALATATRGCVRVYGRKRHYEYRRHFLYMIRSWVPSLCFFCCAVAMCPRSRGAALRWASEARRSERPGPGFRWLCFRAAVGSRHTNID